MFLVQNSLRYVNIMTFENILGVCLFRTGIQCILKIKLNLLNLKHGVQRSHSEVCSLKMHATLYVLFSNILCCILGCKKIG